MSKIKTIILGIFVVSGLFIAVSALLVKLYVTPERVRTLVQTGLEEALQRPVTLGAVSVGLFTGIRMEELKIKGKKSDDVLLSAQNIEMSYDFNSLFHGELRLGKILIMQPQLRLVREADGRLNIDDLLKGHSARENDVAASSPTKGAAAPISFIVKRFSLEGGSLLFLDRRLNQVSPYRYKLDDLGVDVENFALGEVFPVRIRAKLNDRPFSMEMRFSFEDGLEQLHFKSHQLDLVPFLPYLKGYLPGSLGRGLLSTDISIDREHDDFVAKGDLTLEKVDLSLNLKNPLHWNQVRIAVTHELTYHTRDQVVDVKKLRLEIDGLTADYQGKILLNQVPQVAGEASLQILDLRKISSLLPLEIREQVATYGIAGALDLQVQVEGEPVVAQAVRQATLKVSELQASLGGVRPALNGTLSYKAGRIRGSQLKVDLNDQHLQLDLEATQVFSNLPHLEMTVSTDKFNLDPFFPGSRVGENSAQATRSQVGSVVPKAPLRGTPAPPLSVKALLKIKDLNYREVLFENIEGQMVLQDGLFRIDHMIADLAGGHVKLSTVTVLGEADLPLSGDFSCKGITLSTLTDALLPKEKGSISGSLTATSHFSTHGGAIDPLAVLQAKGTFDLQSGEIKGGPLLAEFSRFLANPELQVVGFSRFSGTYGIKLKEGTIDSKLESRHISIAPKGQFTLNGGLDLTLETRFDPETMAKVGVGGKGLNLLKDELGWSLFPLKVKGTYTSPRFLLDSSSLTKQLKKGVVQELERELQNKLGGKTENVQKQQMRQLLNGTLKQLFGN
ncbi:DUF748 domain-containing protein [Geopsychrobacter electrodiphilus]|uniref:DUF748 domain-containing protein n=1 Tax=Geopsychrobacter electrodiphilus TaxID=225196 RepID=UPI0003A94C27|nr:DUF748 domain-containing protein [Geopsychrobacter electrodiphilus]